MVESTPYTLGFTAIRSRNDRSGITLLEVLVACGILVFALSGIAAILPAAGSRLAESVAEDRAALLTANVYADLQAEGVLAHTLFATSTSSPLAFNLTAPASAVQQLRTLAMGLNVTNIVDLLPGESNASKAAPDYFFDQFHVFPSTATGRPQPPLPPWPPILHQIWPYSQPSGAVAIKTDTGLPIDSRRDFFIQDDVQYAADTMASSYENNGLGSRAFKRGVCWGATLAARGNSTAPGSEATLSIAIFKKPSDPRGIDLTEVSALGGLYSLPAGQETIRSTFLRPCNYVLAIPAEVSSGIPLPPKWFRITSSWTQQSSNAAQRISYVTLPPEASAYTTPTGSGKQLLVVGFSGVIRVDEFPVTLK
jgi:type II secretory pathway pseudopilin PulG